MPTTPAKNLLYRAALPILAPHSRGQMTHHASGHPLTTLPNYERILAKHHVFGASLLLQDGANCALCNTSTAKPEHLAQENTRYRVASITKMATALVTLRCIDNGLFALDSEAASLLPDGEKAPALSGVTVRHLLCHTSGLRDLPILDSCLKEGKPYTELLRQPEIRACAPGQQLIYSNFGFGLLGSLIEQAIEMGISALVKQDVEKAEQAIKFDVEVDEQEKTIEALCMKLLLQQQPVAKDLRLISAALKMITDMERIGDHAADISEMTILMADSDYEKSAINMEVIKEMAKETTDMVIKSVDAFVNKDLELARWVINRDDVVDDLFDSFRKELIQKINENVKNGEMATDMLMVAKYFERIGDHATNIAEWVIYSITGKHEDE